MSEYKRGRSQGVSWARQEATLENDDDERDSDKRMRVLYDSESGSERK